MTTNHTTDLESLAWAEFSERYHAAERRELEIFPGLRAEWEQWKEAWFAGARSEREAMAKQEPCAWIMKSMGSEITIAESNLRHFQPEHVKKQWKEVAKPLFASPVPIPEGRQPKDNDAFLIFFDDCDRRPEIFMGEGAKDAAQRRYEAISMSWNAHLFVKIDSNSRDAAPKHPTSTEGGAG